MNLHVVLYQPEIPANTGNIARTCVATNTTLHLIRPLGFSTDDRMLKRAGLDYWKFLTVYYYDSLQDFFIQNKGQFFYITKFGNQMYSEIDVSQRDEAYYFLFGRESGGLPEELLNEHPERCLRLPMTDSVRALNLSNAVAILVYEALRQQGFPNLK